MAQKRKIGHIEPAGENRWYVTVTRGKRADGSPRTVNKTVEGTYEDADIECMKIAARMGEVYCSGNSLTLSQYYFGIFRDSWSNRGEKRSAGTLAQYDSQMKNNVLPRIGDRPIASISHGALKSTVMCASSPRQCKTVLRAVMRAAYDDGFVPDRPMERRIVTPHRKRPQRRPWSAQEAAQALSAMQGADPRIEAYCILGLSGFRLEESLGLRPCDVSLQETVDIITGEHIRSLTATIARTYTDADGLKEKAKNDFSMRSMPVIVQCRERLLRIIADSRPADPEMVPEWSEGRIVPYSNSALYKRWKAACEALGLRFIPPDMLRHTSETLMQAAGVQDTLVSRLHGHTELKTDYRHYMRPGIEAAERAAQEVHKIMPSGS